MAKSAVMNLQTTEPIQCRPRINPWLSLPSSPPFVLSSDREFIAKHNERYGGTDFEVHLTALPEPHTGNTQAGVVLLSLNPGHTEGDATEHADPTYAAVIRSCHAESPVRYPFYPLDPAYQQMLAGQWWMKKTRALREVVGVDAVAQGLLCVQFFPYHSRRYRPLLGGAKIPSQEWGFQLVLEAISRNAVIVLMRNRVAWFRALPQLAQYDSRRLFELQNRRNPTISSKNCPRGFEIICEALLTHSAQLKGSGMAW